MVLFTAAVFVSAFLLFAVQPMVAKFLLPAFGGTAAVWSTCLVFFQTLLLAGYAYAHWLRLRFSPLAQRWIHLGVLAVALLFLPPAPTPAPTATTSGTPVWELLRCLLTSIGVPFFALSATAPLMMEWFRQRFPERSPHRLYAFSNAGSLLALIAYPAFFEPVFTRSSQARVWAFGLGFFLVLCALVAWRSRAGAPTGPPGAGSKIFSSISGRLGATQNNAGAGTDCRRLPVWLWIALPACGSGLLLALTNQLTQDVAPMPLLWVAPMAVYLVTFILCFESTRTYKRGFFIPCSFVCLLLLAWLLDVGYLQGFWIQVSGYLCVLFFTCMICHGELYRLRPSPEHLTAYYLAISFGGALGGSFVALVAPALFKTLLEIPILALAIATLVAVILSKEQSCRLPAKAACLGVLAVAGSLGYVLYDLRKESVCFTRSFYGAYRVKEGPTLFLDGVDYPLAHGPARVLLSGQIYHGLQFTNPPADRIATTYYCEEGGLGLAFRELPMQTNRNIGAIGLGTGTLAAYAKPGDRIRFYEINLDVLRLAQTWFTFLTNCPANVEVTLGDGRLSLERESDQQFDLLVLDAFAGDSIPMHLLTREAMSVYKRHLKPDGVMAFHISNSHLDLEPVVRALAGDSGLTAMAVPPEMVDPREGKLASIWMLLSGNPKFLSQPRIAELLAQPASLRRPILWTDDYSSILPILQ